ncbi:MAG: AAA family ATPase [Thermoplasmata archaeon]
MTDELRAGLTLESSPSTSALERRSPSPSIPKLLHPQDLPCIGRREALARLDRALLEARGGTGSTWVFTGPAGIGKSRLLREVERLAGGRGFRVLWGYSLPHSAAALFPFGQILRRLDDGRLPRPRATSRSVAHRFLALTDAIERAAERQPLLLLIDDLNDADAESVRMVALLARLVTRERVVVAAGFREDGEGAPSGAAAALAAAQRAGFIRTIELEPLDELERLALLAAYLGEPTERLGSDDRVERLVRRVGGNPYFLVETVAQLIAEGEIVGTRAGWRLNLESGSTPTGASSPAEVPVNVRQLILDRYDHLPPAAREAVRLAALLGVEFDTAPLASALDRPPADLLALLNRLADNGWPIRADPHHHGRFAFEHSLLQECLADPAAVRLDPTAARRLESWWGEHRPDDRLTLIRLRLSLGDEEGAVSATGERVRLAIAGWESRLVPDLLRWVGRSLSPGGEADRRLTEVYLEVAQTLRERLEFEVGQKLLVDLEERDLPEATRWRVALWKLEMGSRHGAGPLIAGLEEFERGLPSGAVERSAELALRIAYVRGLTAVWRKPPAEAWREIGGLIRRLGPSGYVFERCRLYENGVVAISNGGRLLEARHVLRSARRLARRAGVLQGPLGATLAHCQAFVDRIGRDATRSSRTLRQVVGSYRRLALPALEAEAVAELASAEMSLRRFGPCREHLAQALRVGTRLGIEYLVGYVHVLEGSVHLFDGRWEEARRSLKEARDVFATAPAHPFRPVIAVGLAWARAETGEAPAARAELAELIEAAGVLHFAYEPETFRVLARAYELERNPVSSRRALRRAIASASRIRDWPNLAGSLTEYAAWMRAHGTRREAARWEKRYQEVARVHRLRRDTDWGGIAFRQTPADGAVPAPVAAQPGTPARPTGPHLTDLVLRCIAAGLRGRSGATGSPAGITQQGIARSIGVSRSRFAKALRRLEQRGWVQRRAVRHEDSPRRVLAYTITPAGQRAVRQTLPPGDRLLARGSA